MIINKTIGSMLIIAGTTIGAGMLALPIASSGLGFLTAMVILFFAWCLMTYTALLTLELHQHAPPNATLNTLAKNILGKKGQFIANFSMIFLFYSLCAAYIAGGGGQLQLMLSNWSAGEVPPQTGAIAFALLFGSIITLGASTVDKINRVLFIIKVMVLTSIFFILTPHIQGEYLLNMPMQQGLIISAIPVIVTSFGFHGSIPSIVKYMGFNIQSLRKVMIIGASMPLVIYLFWQIVSQGVISQQNLYDSQGLDGFIASLSSLLQSSAIANTLTIFANLALATSFLGVSLGLFDFFSDVLNKGDSNKDRFITALVTFTPPLGFALFYPQGFIMALGYAAIALVILAIFLPVLMVWKQRRKTLDTAIQSGVNMYQVRGGKVALTTAAVLGVFIISAQFMQMLGMVPVIH
ncbi:aromatic amino acid transport family protein [Colwellia psychrerythraea]|uniref:Aromatic amino acid permease n=1 Tax=Colwellia psychrerythraea TaxID=28229 RepID=A0A099K9S1_COLPS|nr:aromatic amino acid transport family protein [Colwellia psychrerythraea]KGJ86817.1 aromatic amino acid transporter [Colwellia psychrerythraea]